MSFLIISLCKHKMFFIDNWNILVDRGGQARRVNNDPFAEREGF